MIPYFVIVGTCASKTSALVDKLTEDLQLVRAKQYTTMPENSATCPQDYIFIRPNGFEFNKPDMIFTSVIGGYHYGLTSGEVDGSCVARLPLDDARAAKAFCIGRSRTCILIGLTDEGNSEGDLRLLKQYCDKVYEDFNMETDYVDVLAYVAREFLAEVSE